MSEVFNYSDPDGEFQITIGEEEVEVVYAMSGDLSSVLVTHCPHDMEEFCSFLLSAAYELQAELGRQELEGML